MKIKLNPVQYIFIFYIGISAYFIFTYFGLQQHLADIGVVNFRPVAYGLLIISSSLLALSLFSLFRIPIFHYLFKMVNLWLVILCGSVLFLYFKYVHIFPGVINTETPQKIAEFFPGSNSEIFRPMVLLLQEGLSRLNNSVIIIFMIMTLLLTIIQLILYMPSSLRYVYYTHVSPVKYSLKHILVSLLLFVPLLFVSIFLFKLDSSLNPELENLLSQKRHTIKDTDNQFYPMLSLWIPNVTDRVAYGKNWLSGFRKIPAYYRNHQASINPAAYPGYQKLSLGGMPKTDQAEINQLYIQRLQNDNAKLDMQIKNYIRKYQAPLQVARSFYSSKHYLNPIKQTSLSYTSFYNDYSGSFLSLQRLNLLENLIGSSNDTKTMIKNIRANYYFNMNVIRHSSDPIVKLLFIKKQDVVIQFLYSLLNNPKYQNVSIYKFIDHIPELTKAVIALNLIAKNKLQLINNELVQANNKLSHSQSILADFSKYTYKYHKTLNCIFERATRKYNLDNSAISVHINRQTTPIQKAALDNVIGDAICKTSITDNKDDIFIRSVATNGRIMILKARSKILENKIDVFNIGAFLNNNSQIYHNPFTDRPLKWDRDMHQIYFEYNIGRKKVRVSY